MLSQKNCISIRLQAICIPLFIFSFSYISNLLGQQNNFEFDNFSVRQGLPHNNIHHITQDHLGYIWMCSPAGLIRYDGYEFVQYLPDPNDSTSIGNTFVRQTLADAYGNLWIASNNGLYVFDHKTQSFEGYFHDANDSSSLTTNGIFTLFEDSDSTLWLGTIGQGLERFNRKENIFTHYRHDPNDSTSISSDAVNIICEDLLGNLWIGTSNGLNKFEKKTGKSIRFYHEKGNNNSIAQNVITNLLLDQKGMLWILTRSNIQIYDPYKNIFSYMDVSENELEELRNNRVITVAEDDQNNIWFGTEWEGIKYFDREKSRLVSIQNNSNDKNSLCGNRILSIFNDKFGTVWIGTFLSGISKFNYTRSKFELYQHSPSDVNTLGHNYIWAIHEDKEGRVWIGTNSNGIDIFDPNAGKFSNFKYDPIVPYSIGSDLVNNFYEDKQGDLWIGTYGGGLNKLIKFENRIPYFKRYRHNSNNPESISSNDATAVYEDRSGSHWIGTYNGGLNLFNREKETFVNYRHDPNDSTSIAENIVWVIFEDSKNNLWIGTDQNGMDLFDRERGTFIHYLNSGNIVSTILAIIEDKKGRLWIGTHYEGLLLFDKEEGILDRYNTENGLPSNSVKSIIEDNEEFLWIATENSLTKLDYDNKLIKNFDVTDGLQPGNFSSNGSCKGNDGRLYFSGTKGFNSFYPNNLIENERPPQIVLKNIKIYDRILPFGNQSQLKYHINSVDEIKLKYDQNDISIEFAALHYANSNKNTYKYILENYDKDWRNVGTNKNATYTSLDPGEYIFRVTAANSDGYWNENQHSLKIKITPPFWETIWFRTLVTILIGGLIYYGYRKRVRNLEWKRVELENRVKERTLAAEKLNKALKEVENLKNRLQSENIYLQDEINVEHNFENIICTSQEMKLVLQNVEKVSSTEATVLILGETGTGKELIARAIHSVSPRSDRPLVKVNCAALPENLIESELFGHEKGAFTGAISQKIGRFELANGGTIFLDEIGDLPSNLQTKLLRVLQESEIDRVGGTKSFKVDVRVIAATNRNLEKAIEKKEFREDLFYRLNVFPIKIPALRHRKEDIPLLVKYFMDKYNVKVGKNVELVSQKVMNLLTDYNWPGNIRELENIIERAIILCNGKSLTIGDWLKQDIIDNDDDILYLEEIEKRHIEKVLDLTNGRVSGDKGAAKILNINPQTLVSRIKKLGIRKDQNL